MDGFPVTRENWAAMIDTNNLPDFVLSIEDDQAPKDFLLARFTKTKGIPNPSLLKAEEESNEEQTVSVTYSTPLNCFYYCIYV